METENYKTLRWYLIKTKPREEERVVSYLNFAAYPFLFPTFWKTSFTAKEKEKKPLFPGYVFAQLILKEAYHNIRYTRGVTGFVRFGNMPATVPDKIVEALKQEILEDGSVRMYPGSMVKGMPVKIKEGVFKGFEGVFVENLNDGRRIAILLRGLNSARAEVDRAFVSTVV